MLELLTCGGGENVPAIPGACATRNFTYLVRGPRTSGLTPSALYQRCPKDSWHGSRIAHKSVVTSRLRLCHAEFCSGNLNEICVNLLSLFDMEMSLVGEIFLHERHRSVYSA